MPQYVDAAFAVEGASPCEGGNKMHHRAINAPVGVRGRRKSLMLGTVLAFAMILTSPVCAQGVKLPSGGQVAAGQASVATSGDSTTITQSSGKAIINWTDFSIGRGGTVQFDNGTGATLNRVTGGSVSSIDGLLSATGSVYLINPNGVIIGKSGVVRTDGSFVASTLDLGDAAFLKGGDLTFDGASSAAVVNLGKVGALGGDVALIAAHVENQGTLAAANGSIGLLAGHQVLMRDQSVDGGKFAVLVGGADTSVTNTGAITAAAVELRAAGGNIYALAGNTRGVINATGVTTKDGRVFLTAGDGGSVTVSGTQIAASTASGAGGAISVTGQTINVASDAVLDASATSATGQGGQISVVADMTSGALTFAGTALARGGLAAGNGGSVETSGATVDFDDAVVDTSAGHGTTGTWLTDPYDLTIGTAAAQTIQTNLATTSVTLQTTATGTSAIGTPNAAGVGDITITAPISWNSGNTLTLDAYHGINIDAPLTATGAGKVVLTTNDGGTAGDYGFGLTSQGFTGSLNFTGGSSSGAGLTINGNVYSLLYSVADLQSINNQFGDYALADNLDGTGQTYTDSVLTKLSGTLTGLGHTLNNFTVTSTTPYGNVGPIGMNLGTLRDIGVVGGSVNSNAGNQGGSVGGLVGDNANGATVNQSYATDQVTGSSGSLGGAAVGGLVGSNFFDSTISKSFATGSVTVNGDDGGAGGLVGVNNRSAIIQSFATGRVTATGSGANAGGLAGLNSFNGSIEQSYATGSVSATGTIADAGGLVGANSFGSTIDQGFATGDVASSGTATHAGGVVGFPGSGTSVTNSYYDALTTGRAAGAQADGSTGLSTTALQGALPTGFASSVWATGAGLYPYLKWQYATTPEAITGTAVSLTPTTSVAGASVNIYMNGSVIGATSVGANGYYYALVAGNTIKYNTPYGTTLSLAGDSGVDAITYSDTHTASATSVATGNTIVGRNEVAVSQPTLSALFAGMGSAFGPAEMAYLKTTGAFSYQDFYAYAPTFTIDQAVDVTSVFKITGLNYTGKIIDAAPITVEPGATLMWTSDGALAINAPMTVKGSGDVNLHYDYFQTSNGGVANPLDFSFGNSGALTYLTSGGGVATSNQGGQFVLNNVEYTLIYSMAQLDSIDGINGVTGANEGTYGAGLNGNYALANTLNAAGTIYSRDLINNFEGAFEGLNNSIDNLTIKDTGATSDSVGLFGAFHGTVRDINLVNVSVSDNDSNNNPNVGGLAGYSDGNIYNVSVSGDVNATNRLSVNVGGVVGYAPNGTIYNARASDTVEGSIGDVVGGLVGLSYAANISQSSATGNVTSPGATMGGLVGFTEPGTTITASYATGNVSGGPNSLEGGLVGYNLGEIYQSYATGLVSSSSTSSGLGGLVGSNNGGVVSSYWDTDTSGQARSAGGSGLTTAQLQSGTLPTGFSATIWSATPGQNPKLKVAQQ